MIQSPDKNNSRLIIVSNTGDIDDTQKINQIIDTKNSIVQNGKLFSTSRIRLWKMKQESQKYYFIELPCMDVDDLGRNIKMGVLLLNVDKLTATDITTVAKYFAPPLHITEENIDTVMTLYNKSSVCMCKLFFVLLIAAISVIILVFL